MSAVFATLCCFEAGFLTEPGADSARQASQHTGLFLSLTPQRRDDGSMLTHPAFYVGSGLPTQVFLLVRQAGTLLTDPSPQPHDPPSLEQIIWTEFRLCAHSCVCALTQVSPELSASFFS